MAACKDLGADVCINYKTEDFVARVKVETGGKGYTILSNIIISFHYFDFVEIAVLVARSA